MFTHLDLNVHAAFHPHGGRGYTAGNPAGPLVAKTGTPETRLVYLIYRYPSDALD